MMREGAHAAPHARALHTVRDGVGGGERAGWGRQRARAHELRPAAGAGTTAAQKERRLVGPHGACVCEWFSRAGAHAVHGMPRGRAYTESVA